MRSERADAPNLTVRSSPRAMMRRTCRALQRRLSAASCTVKTSLILQLRHFYGWGRAPQAKRIFHLSSGVLAAAHADVASVDLGRGFDMVAMG